MTQRYQLPRSEHELAGLIDGTLLKPAATRDDILRLCDEALQQRFAAVCVNPIFLAEVARRLAGSPVKPCTVVGFPLGASVTAVKMEETRRAIGEGALEIDMVLFVGGLRAGEKDLVRDDIAAVVKACREGGACCKVILETCLLTTDEKAAACLLCLDAGADFVKTSTGFSTGGATAEDVALMAGLVRTQGLGVKASGGIRTATDARRLIEAGATRIGTSSGVQILREYREHPWG